MLLFLSTMTMVTLSDHIMVLWIAIEATTLASAPLIFTHRSGASLEATWKYVLICSVGIAMALVWDPCFSRCPWNWEVSPRPCPFPP